VLDFVSVPQQVETRYESVADLDGFAWDWGGAHKGVRVQVNRLVGFCLLVRRAVVDAIGLLDEQFGVGCFDDDDYCLRAIQVGYRAVIAGDAFVHHWGGRMFVGSTVDFGPIMRENERRFRAEWAESGTGILPVNGHGLESGNLDSGGTGSLPMKAHGLEGSATFAVAMAPGGGLRMSRKQEKPLLSLCMIVRDSAHTLPACLESICPWVDETVIVNTGSVDETPRIVESFGGRLFPFTWCDDFSAARNESLRHARGDWLFWIDSDDTIPPECGRMLLRLVDQELPAKVVGYVVQVHCPGGGENGEPDTDVTAVDHLKLFRNRAELRFDGRIHEQILPAIRACGCEVAWTDIYVVHSGSD
jgi:O-antigen biosynthesis protein